MLCPRAERGSGAPPLIEASQPAGSLGSVLGRQGEPRDQRPLVKPGKADLNGIVRVCQGSKTVDD